MIIKQSVNNWIRSELSFLSVFLLQAILSLKDRVFAVLFAVITLSAFFFIDYGLIFPERLSELPALLIQKFFLILAVCASVSLFSGRRLSQYRSLHGHTLIVNRTKLLRHSLKASLRATATLAAFQFVVIALFVLFVFIFKSDLTSSAQHSANEDTYFVGFLDCMISLLFVSVIYSMIVSLVLSPEKGLKKAYSESIMSVSYVIFFGLIVYLLQYVGVNIQISISVVVSLYTLFFASAKFGIFVRPDGRPCLVTDYQK
ncbi:hypothetical protein [Vibrio alginolyticus]|uniref:hypothetical protein n=1 Tax=Vibrio alginolyticus TaxID=663 RepID=UPI00211A9FA1|nr:hypothetical protein [Vibrio alginolyticus]MCQ9070899.1 hypothetical protein [Vibrio alginolyticus]